jgi:F-type H+-transporting ATPase subunit b
MSIDWFTFTAQIINFLVLVLLLRRFLYGPIVRTMQAREASMASRLEEAEQIREQAEAKTLQFEEKLKELETHREKSFQQVRDEADEHRHQLRQESRREVEQKRDEWLEAIDREREELLHEFRHQIGRLAADVARQTLSELATEDLEARMLDKFVTQIQDVDDQQQAVIQSYLQENPGDISVRTTFELSDQQRQQLRQLIRENFGQNLEISFDTAPELVCGVELDLGGYSFGWNVEQHVRELNLDFGDRLRKQK